MKRKYILYDPDSKLFINSQNNSIWLSNEPQIKYNRKTAVRVGRNYKMKNKLFGVIMQEIL